MSVNKEGKESTEIKGVRLKGNTHKRLSAYLLELMNEEHNPFLNMDDAINALLDFHEKYKQKK